MRRDVSRLVRFLSLTYQPATKKANPIMNKQSLVRRSLALVFTLSVTTGAVAEPARHGYRDAVIAARCSVQPAASGLGYRGTRARPSADPATAGAVAVGYRASFARVESPVTEHQIARVDRSCAN
jgi:hypothetical protein